MNECEREERENYRKYTYYVNDVISKKYRGELVDYPNIVFDKFK